MNSFGRIFRISLFGESHGSGIGVVVDGIPHGIPLSETDFEADLARRRGGKPGTTPRTEADQPELLSGVLNGFTTGAPVAILFRNTNVRSSDYEQFRDIPRPGHADYAARIKYEGFADLRGGGHFSGRLSVALVAAGVIAKKILPALSIHAEILEIGGEQEYESLLETIREKGDSVGGLIRCTATGLPAGWGEPFFDSVESVLSHLLFSIPAIKGVEFGSGFGAASMTGSRHNDPIIDISGKTSGNHAGGINGGITNGNELVFRVAVKPASSIAQPQESMNFNTGRIERFHVEGRHDACIALRMPVIVEAVTAIGLADLMLLHKSLD